MRFKAFREQNNILLVEIEFRLSVSLFISGACIAFQSSSITSSSVVFLLSYTVDRNQIVFFDEHFIFKNRHVLFSIFSPFNFYALLQSFYSKK
jgi:hypothetical protein